MTVTVAVTVTVTVPSLRNTAHSASQLQIKMFWPIWVPRKASNSLGSGRFCFYG